MNTSNAESRVLFFLQKGLPNNVIASEIGISEKTVKFHLTNIYKKYEVKSRAELLVKLTGFSTTEKEDMMKQLTPQSDQKKQSLTQAEKVQFIDSQFKVGEAIEHLHSMMKTVTKDQVNPATVNAACNCVARLNETINTAINAAKFLNDR